MGVFKYIYTIYKAEWDKFQHNVHYTSQFDKQNIEKEGYFINHELLIAQPMVATWNMGRNMPSN